MTKFRFITAFVLYFLIFYSVIISIFLFVGKFIILPEYISSIHKSRIRFTTAIKETVENDVKRGDTFLVEKMLSRIIGIDDLTEVVLNDGRENHPFSDETIDVYCKRQIQACGALLRLLTNLSMQKIFSMGGLRSEIGYRDPHESISSLGG